MHNVQKVQRLQRTLLDLTASLLVVNEIYIKLSRLTVRFPMPNVASALFGTRPREAMIMYTQYCFITNIISHVYTDQTSTFDTGAVLQ